jgi:hypothetical protein
VHAPRAAIVTCTKAEVVPGTELAPLDSDTHAHLFVFTPSEVGGFPEFNVPYSEGGEPGTWSLGRSGLHSATVKLAVHVPSCR